MPHFPAFHGIFFSNLPRYYRKDTVSGHWVRYHTKEETAAAAAAHVTQTGSINNATHVATTASLPVPAAGHWAPPPPSLTNSHIYY